jgi:hypothetical protein
MDANDVTMNILSQECFSKIIFGVTIGITYLVNTLDKCYAETKDTYVGSSTLGDINILCVAGGRGHYQILDVPDGIVIPISPRPALRPAEVRSLRI